MNVLLYINTLGLGGAEMMVSNYAMILKSQGINVAVLVLYPVESVISEKISDAGIQIYSLYETAPKKPFGKILRLITSNAHIPRRFKKICEVFRPDILHVNTNAKYVHLFDFNPQKMIYTFHADVLRALEIGGQKNRDNIKTLANRGMSFTALSHKMLDDIHNLYSESDVELVPNGIDLQQIRNSVYSKEEFLQVYGLPSDAFILGHVGRFHKVKNHEKIIRVFKELIKIRPNSYLFLIGDGSNEDRIRIQKLIESSGVANKVFCLGNRNDATSIMSIFSGFIMPSYSESFALALLEAQSHNVRCVASSNIPEEVFCNSNCFRIDLDESDLKWAELLLSDETRDNEGCLDKFDIRIVTNKLIDYYDYINNGKSSE